MKTFLLVLLSAALGIGVAIAAVAWDVGPSTAIPTKLGLAVADDVPHAKVGTDEVLYDARQVEQYSTQKHVFVFRNDGEVPLRLILGETSCQCTGSVLAKDELPPGDSTEVTVEWKTEQLGEFRHTATVLTNDPARPRVSLTVVGIVTPTVSVEPSELILGKFPSSLDKRAEVRLFSFRDEILVVSGYELTNQKLADHFDVNIAPAPVEELKGAGAKSGYLVTVTVKPGLPPGPIQQTIRLDRPDGSRFEVPVRGTVVEK